MSVDYLKEIFYSLEESVSYLKQMNESEDKLDEELVSSVINLGYEINAEANERLTKLKQNNSGCGNCCCCNNNSGGVNNLVESINRLIDKLKEGLVELEKKYVKDEFTSKMFKQNNITLYERKLGFLVNEETFKKLVSYVSVNSIDPQETPLIKLVVRHPAFPYAMIGLVQTRDITERVKQPSPFYTSRFAPYMYLEIENFRYDDVHPMHVDNMSTHYAILSYFTYYSAAFVSKVMDVRELKDVPTSIYGEESVISSVTDKDMSFHDYLKFVDTKELATSSYNGRYFMVKYEDGYLLKDKNRLTNEVLYLTKDSNKIDALNKDCGCDDKKKRFY